MTGTVKKVRKPVVYVEPVSAKNSETGQDVLYFVIDGVRVAYREAGKWVSLVDYVTITDDLPEGTPCDEGGTVEVLPEPTTDRRH
jgi:hypothetical protein